PTAHPPPCSAGTTRTSPWTPSDAASAAMRAMSGCRLGAKTHAPANKPRSGTSPSYTKSVGPTKAIFESTEASAVAAAGAASKPPPMLRPPELPARWITGGRSASGVVVFGSPHAVSPRATTVAASARRRERIMSVGRTQPGSWFPETSILSDQRLDEFVGIELHQIADRLAEADELDGK